MSIKNIDDRYEIDLLYLVCYDSKEYINNDDEYDGI